MASILTGSDESRKKFVKEFNRLTFVDCPDVDTSRFEDLVNVLSVED